MKNKFIIGCFMACIYFYFPFRASTQENKNNNSFLNTREEAAPEYKIPKYIPPAALEIGLNLEYKN